jgi:organic hydroperoxide reductase OsmC/OhrA
MLEWATLFEEDGPMSEYRATIWWERATDDFAYDTYNRSHTWTFGGGLAIEASSAPEYRGDEELPNPEEALVAALSSCHMLTFLAIAARKRIAIDSYEDEAVGFMEKNEEGKLAVTRVILRPRIAFGGPKPPSADEIARMHEQSHANCFIANSVKTEVAVEPQS